MKKTSNVRERRPGTWEVRVYVGREGHPHDYYTVHGTRADAEALYASKLVERHDGSYRSPQQQTVKAYLEGWLESHALRPNTRQGYRRSLELHVYPVMGHKRVAMVTEEDIEALTGALVRSGRSAATARRTVAPVLSALRDAKVRLHPALPAERPPESASLEAAHIKTLLERYQEFVIGPLAVFALLTGLRRSELCGLRWADIDLEARAVTVRRGRHVVKGEGYESDPKSRRSSRRIALPKLALDVLGEPGTGYVFVSPRGRPWHPDTVSHYVKAMLEELGLPGSLHPLRHSQATMLMALNINPRVVSGRLGHASVVLTLDRYSHVAPVVDREAADAIDGYVSGKLGVELGFDAAITG